MSRTTHEGPSGNQPDDGDCVVCGDPADGIDARTLQPVCRQCAKIRTDGGVDLDFYVVVDPDVGDLFPGEVAPIRVDTDAFDYRTTIETDIFGTKGSGQADGDTDGGGSDTSASGGETDATDTPDGDGDGSDGRDGNDTPDDGSPEPSPTPTPTPTPDPGPLPTDTPGGGIL